MSRLTEPYSGDISSWALGRGADRGLGNPLCPSLAWTLWFSKLWLVQAFHWVDFTLVNKSYHNAHLKYGLDFSTCRYSSVSSDPESTSKLFSRFTPRPPIISTTAFLQLKVKKFKIICFSFHPHLEYIILSLMGTEYPGIEYMNTRKKDEYWKAWSLVMEALKVNGSLKWVLPSPKLLTKKLDFSWKIIKWLKYKNTSFHLGGVGASWMWQYHPLEAQLTVTFQGVPFMRVLESKEVIPEWVTHACWNIIFDVFLKCYQSI